MHHRRCRVPIELKEEIEAQLSVMAVQDIMISQVEPSPWISSLTYLHKATRALRVCLDPKDLNKTIICKHYKAPH